jgi:hypothetical protein
MEEAMPRRRRVKKGSFDGHFDELVKQFPDERAEPRRDREDGEADPDGGNIHDRFFERAWSAARNEPQRPATNSQIEKARSLADGGS